MTNPASTYRIQFSSAFTFSDLKEIIPYLDSLGISTVYASPIFKARSGSTHGYDITDPLIINPEIGTLEEFREISHLLKQRNMTWLQDIVPNHMAYDGHNPWLGDIFEKGPESSFYNFFDINWNYDEKDFSGKVMAPFLGDDVEMAMAKNEIQLRHEGDALFICYFDHKYPVSEHTYSYILQQTLKTSEQDTGSFSMAEDLISLTRDQKIWPQPKKGFKEMYALGNMRNGIDGIISFINSTPLLLQAVLDMQFFRFTHWKTTEKKINYRRFFTVNDLICLRMEDKNVFQTYHKFIKQLCDEGLIDHLRIDHIDGLFDPGEYLRRLRNLVGQRYLIIEKIRAWDEALPSQWPIEGSSGYGFLATLNQVFTKPDDRWLFTSAYTAISSGTKSFDELVYDKKIFILKERMAGELHNLYSLMEHLALLPKNSNSTKVLWMEALGAFLAAFPIYRIYPQDFPLKVSEQIILDEAMGLAVNNLPTLKDECRHLRQIFLGTAGLESDSMKYFLQRCQQFTGPLSAKGVEDTTFYIYNRLISHNEVGDTPGRFGISINDFHKRMLSRKKHFPLSINATATHDTKRGEDARMRINVLSEIPKEWFAMVEKWTSLNTTLRDGAIPDENEEYFIYQSLIGAWPANGITDESFINRSREYIQKVLREAKVHSTWSEPDEQYEKSVNVFLERIFNSKKFRAFFVPFAEKTSFFGVIYSLAQIVIKCTAPGIPDVYQGTELWDLSYVDPDNRRPVDYFTRNQYLEKLTDSQNFDPGLLKDFKTARLKIFTLTRALQLRQKHQQVFDEGAYIPLITMGKYRENLISYIRKFQDVWFIVLVPARITSLCGYGQFPLGAIIWKDSSLHLPEDAPHVWENIYTGEIITIKGKFFIKDVLTDFPVVILKNVLKR